MPWGALAGAVVGGIGSAIGGGSGPSSATTTTTSSPYLANLINQIGGNVQNILSNPSEWPQYYPGATVSGFTPAQQSALSTLESEGSQPVAATTSALDFANALESGDFLGANPANPTLSAFSSGALTNPMSNPDFAQSEQQLISQAVPGVVSQFVSGGNMNNPAMAYATAQGATNAVAPYLSNLYQEGQQNQLNAAETQGSLYNQGVQSQVQGLGLAPTTASLPFIAPQEEYQAGTAEQSQNQNVLNSLIAQWNFGQTEPLNIENWAASIGYGAPGGTTVSSTPYYTNSLANTLSGVVGGASLGNSLFGGSGNSNGNSGLSSLFGMFGSGGGSYFDGGIP